MLNEDTKRHFKIFRDPFKNDVTQPSDVFLAPDQRYVREAMYSTAKHGGFMAIVGESGSGKTTLFNDLYDRIQTEEARILVASPSVLDVELGNMRTRLTARRILECLLASLTDQAPRMSMQRLTDQVRNALRQVSQGDSAHTVVLMIEEAHRLYPATLKSIKSMLEISQGHKQLFSVILIGQTELLDLLNEVRHPELREVIRRCETVTLNPLDANLEAYLAHKFRRVGVEPSTVFSPDAYDAIRAKKGPVIRERTLVKPSQLYPLIVNNLVTRAMNATVANGAPLVSAAAFKSL